MSKPITPNEVGKVKSSKMPPQVFEAMVNQARDNVEAMRRRGEVAG